MVKHSLFFFYGPKYTMLIIFKAKLGMGRFCRVTEDSVGMELAAPHLGDDFITRVTLPIFCRGKEKKHNFHIAS